MQLAVLILPGVATREALAPTKVLESALGVAPVFLGLGHDFVLGHDPAHRFRIDSLYSLATPDVLVIPGGFGALTSAADTRLVTWIDRVIGSGCSVLAVSTGSLIVCATGRLRGRAVAGHWLCAMHLRRLGCIPSRYPMEVHDRVVTTSGTAAALGGAAYIADLARFGPTV